MYRQMHRKGIPEQQISADELYDGKSLLPHLPTIKKLVAMTGATSLLDYGAGKGLLYRRNGITLPSGERISTVRGYLGVKRIACYDPGVEEHCELPARQFDGVISTDVLEHCPEDDIPWIIEELFSKARKFVFANIACYPAAKKLPSGENAHCTIRPAEWWGEVIKPIASRFPKMLYQFEISKSYGGG
jgi:hypothetical protein